MVNLKNDEYYLNEGISRAEMLVKCQISEGEFDKLISGPSKYELRIIEVSEQRYAYISDSELYDLFD